MIPGIVAGQMRASGGGPSFPLIRSAQAVASTGSEANLTINYTAVSGDLVIVNFSVRSDASFTPGLSDTGWTLLNGFGSNNGSSVTSYVWYKVVTGSGSLTITPISSVNMAAAVVVIQDGTHQGVIVAATGSGNSANPNPQNLAPAWGSAKTLWLAMYSHASGVTASVYPLPDNNIFARSLTTSTGCGTGLCTQSLEAASLDPSTFTVSASAPHITRTIGVQPA